MASVESRNKLIASALCKHLSLDPSIIPADSLGSDVKNLYSNIKAASANAVNQSDEVLKWVEFAEAFPLTLESNFENLKTLNDELSVKSVLLGNGLKTSEADVIVFSAIHSSVINLSNPNKEKLPHVLRWMDYIQHKEDFVGLFEKIPLQKPEFEPPVNGTKGKPAGDKESTKVKAKPAEKEVPEKDNELSVSLLNIQVGLIRNAWKHPSADSLLVEEIDVGETKLRQVVSGLAKYCSPDELTNRLVVLITNVKPGKLRDVMSEGLVLCASNEDHSKVEPLLPPQGAKIGERVSFSGIDGKPEDVLNPKKKQLEKITPNLFTDEKGVATFKGIPFMTSGGPCTSSIAKATIK
ncbi:methionine--tRNA ligase, cytoplasmic isoform X5 [Arachis stenosperma]|uniref:methionine--tRNA ligase, cytoplasmic isoform X5 n=1 Tax=Arachis stenosperma TaxID=217475 RepID=UPI0025AD3E13|nr:methionine--tRNA ligase, cytoplasmic isoform X5 [Arachis stenosperma]